MSRLREHSLDGGFEGRHIAGKAVRRAIQCDHLAVCDWKTKSGRQLPHLVFSVVALDDSGAWRIHDDLYTTARLESADEVFFAGGSDERIEIYDAVLRQGARHRKEGRVAAPEPVSERDVVGRAAISDHEVLRQRPETEPRQEFQEDGIDWLVDADEIAWLGEQQRALRLER